MTQEELSKKIKEKAIELGFSACGISEATFLEEQEQYLQSYLDKRYQGEMRYMENHFEKRLDPRLLVENTKSVVSVLLNYYPSKQQEDKTAPIFSKYAYGKDYHFVMKDRLGKLLSYLQTLVPSTEGRAFVDSAPVLDRSWAEKAGLGWIGKNGNLIAPKMGSFFFIGELLVSTPLSSDSPLSKDFCGTCTRCIDNCPTKAIVAPKQVNGSKCISYATIEYRGEKLPSEFEGKMEDRFFGCDICQDVCPHNRFSTATTIEEFTPIEHLLERKKEEWHSMEKSDFSKWAKGSAFHRSGFKGIKRNLNFIKNE